MFIVTLTNIFHNIILLLFIITINFTIISLLFLLIFFCNVFFFTWEDCFTTLFLLTVFLEMFLVCTKAYEGNKSTCGKPGELVFSVFVCWVWKYKLYEMLSPYFSLIEFGAKTWSMMILANESFLKTSGSNFKASETTLVWMTEMRAFANFHFKILLWSGGPKYLLS